MAIAEIREHAEHLAPRHGGMVHEWLHQAIYMADFINNEEAPERANLQAHGNDLHYFLHAERTRLEDELHLGKEYWEPYAINGNDIWTVLAEAWLTIHSALSNFLMLEHSHFLFDRLENTMHKDEFGHSRPEKGGMI